MEFLHRVAPFRLKLIAEQHPATSRREALRGHAAVRTGNRREPFDEPLREPSALGSVPAHAL